MCAGNTKNSVIFAWRLQCLVAACAPLFAAAESARAATLHISDLYDFRGGGDVCFPRSVIFDGAGALYGAAPGGASGYGAIFKLSPPAAGQTKWTETILYSFKGGRDGWIVDGQLLDGDAPTNDLVLDATGALYGTTWRGGASDLGVVFKLTPPAAGKTKWTETVLWSFKGGTDGAFPTNGVVMDKAGALYGATSTDNAFAQGTAYKLAPPSEGKTQWTKTILHRFEGFYANEGPEGALIVDVHGVLYGATRDQIVFKLAPPVSGQTAWVYTPLYHFNGIHDGLDPTGKLLLDRKGSLYGATLGGGIHLFGSVFRLSPPVAGQSR